MRTLVWVLLLLPSLFLVVGCGERPVATADSGAKSVKKKRPLAKNIPQPATKIDVPEDLYDSPAAALADVKRWVDSKDSKAGQVLLKTEAWLIRRGDAIVPELTARVEDTSEDLAIRMTACRVLSKMGPVGRPAVLAAIDSSPQQLRVKAIESLGRIKPADKASVDKLIKLLDDKEYDIRKAALLGISATEKAGASATTRLMKLLNDTNEDETIRSLAKVALKKVDPRKGLMGADKEK
ncbi:HEAT repeat protein [Anatilimnocola aggregata]|uniref:HEAT repeat protein n=1 Tax=Anatilimnocola aggregata TaxID=2528021 RepID=A0A517Y7T7_9BACT|nr:HEAT repeat domain-containing protein [Anatilimnocola aggregata]QDU26297.1 HEAT repeat protein [Anatilimnocola aggregata]